MDTVFTLLYLLITFCIVYPPVEFVSAGFTVPVLFAKILGSETEDFIKYHIKRSLVTLIVYSLLPGLYIFLLVVLGYRDELSFLGSSGFFFWKCFFTASIGLPILSLYQVNKWCVDNYKNHPTVINLSKFCNNNNNWKSVASDINIEYRRIDKIDIITSPWLRVVATENWVMKVDPFTISLAHQSDATLVVKASDTHSFSPQTSQQVQYLAIEVKTSRRNVSPFTIRIASTDFKDLEDRIAREIAIQDHVKFHKSVVEQFIDTFKETIKSNPKYDYENQVLDQCIGCMQVRPNVKLQKQCGDVARGDNGDSNNCSTCFCRPMWCVDCMAKWFASRQDIQETNVWLSCKCTCPMCRATFCILDVSLLSNVNESNEDT